MIAEIWQRVRRDLTIAFAGLQEATVSIADHVNRRVHKVKVTLDANELEKRIKNDQALLGKKICAEPDDLSLNALYKDPEIRNLVAEIEKTDQALEAIEGIVSPHEALLDFERLLIRSNFVIQHVVVQEGFLGVGKTIRELNLPPQMLIFFIKKKGEPAIAYGKTVIEARDEVTFLCPKKKVQEYISYWRKT
ncbi:MAG: TrkA C-terminal domain-containing protein [Nitrospiria bacterium]